jgi:carboxylate-amine ligase
MTSFLTNSPTRPGLWSDDLFRPGGTFTVGAEEELFLVDAGHRLDPRVDDLVDQLRRTASTSAGVVSRELFAAMVEFATVVCSDAGSIASHLAQLRGSLTAAGGRALAAGVHPAARFGEAELTRSARYERIGESLAGLLRTPTAALQVHVGLPDEQAAMAAYRGMRHRRAVLQAMAANSPFWHGRDSGLASARWAVTSSYPRSGIPPLVRSWDEYVARTAAIVAAAEVPDYTHLWWDARLQPRLGTLEVRVMDAQPSVEVAAGLAALVQGLVRHAVERPVAIDVPSEVLAENSFRVARGGLEARVVDVDGVVRPVRGLAAAALADARSTLAPDGLDRPLSAVEELLAGTPSYQRQRDLHARSGMEAVLADLEV